MADNRSKQVFGQLLQIHTRAQYLADQCTQLAEPLKAGDTIDVPIPGTLTVGSAVNTSTLAAQDVSAEAHGLTTATLSCSLQPMINVQLPAGDETQLMDGNFAAALSLNALQQLRNAIDDALYTYLLSLAYTTSGSYHDNAAAGTLTPQTLLQSIGSLDRAGSVRENIRMFISPEAMGSLAALQQYTSESGNQSGVIGPPRVGTVFGIPVYASRSVGFQRTYASSAYALTSNVMTITVAAGHSFVPGQLITFDTVTAGGDIATPTAIASVGTTSVVLNWTASNSSATEAGTITAQDSACLLVDSGATFVALQKLPSVRRVMVSNRWADNLQVAAIWGRIGVAGHVRAIHL